MDSPNLQTINSIGSPPSNIAENSSIMVPSRRDIFLSTYRRQNITLPDSMMHYIAKNPKNANFYQKMIECCKYFFIKNPILVIDKLYYDNNRWGRWIHKIDLTWKNIDIDSFSSKLWITDHLSVSPENLNNNSVASLIIPKIYQCNFKHLFLSDQSIFLNEFIFLCTSVKELTLYQVTVKNDDGTEVPLEKLVEQLPQIKRFDFAFTTPSNNTSKNTFKKLWKISHLLNYDDFCLFDIPEDFDIDSFYSYMKENKKTRVYLKFSNDISEESKIRLEAIVDEIIETKIHEYRPPCINFPGLDRQKYNKLWNMF